MAKVLAISSHVVRGHVGLDATVPALQHLGHEVWALPTVLLASRPGLGRLVKHDVPAEDLAGMLAALEADGCGPSLDAVLAGYFPSPQSVVAAAQAIAGIKAAKPGIPVLVDPVVGDAGRLYVAQATAEAIRDALLPLATIVTPNLFELSWLTGTTPNHPAEVVPVARGLGPPTVVVTSVRRRVNPKHAQIFDLYAMRGWPAARVAGDLGVNIFQVYLVAHRLTRLLKEEVRYVTKKLE
jgi:pyridoxine kinase